MKKMYSVLLGAAMFCGFLQAGETEMEFKKPADWKVVGNVKWVGEKKDVMEVTGRALLVSTKRFDIDETKSYKLEADVKRISGDATPIYVGFNLFDKDGKQLPAHLVNIAYGTETPLLKPAKPGDKVLYIKDNPLWHKPTLYTVHINARKDLLDLPNYDMYIIAGRKVNNGALELQLKTPVTRDIAAGTLVRGHMMGGYMYTGGYKTMKEGESFEFKGVAKGRAKYGMPSVAWAPGAVKAEVIILVNWSNAKAVTQVKDVELEIK